MTRRKTKVQFINDLEIIDDIDFTGENAERTRAKIRLSELQRLAGLGFTIEAIAKIFNISNRCLTYYLQDPTIKNAWETGKAKANAALAQTAFDLATAGDTTMCIWLTKVHLGWSGEKAYTEGNDKVQIYIPAQMSIEDWNQNTKKNVSTNNENSD